MPYEKAQMDAEREVMRDARARVGLSARRASEFAGFSESMYRKVERGDIDAVPLTAARILRALGVGTDDPRLTLARTETVSDLAWMDREGIDPRDLSPSSDRHRETGPDASAFTREKVLEIRLPAEAFDGLTSVQISMAEAAAKSALLATINDLQNQAAHRGHSA